jgi:hypothetical protein
LVAATAAATICAPDLVSMPLCELGEIVVVLALVLLEPADDELPHPATNAIAAVTVTSRKPGRIS